MSGQYPTAHASHIVNVCFTLAAISMDPGYGPGQSKLSTELAIDWADVNADQEQNRLYNHAIRLPECANHII